MGALILEKVMSIVVQAKVELTEWERDALVSAMKIELRELTEGLHWRTFNPALHHQLIEKLEALSFEKRCEFDGCRKLASRKMSSQCLCEQHCKSWPRTPRDEIS